MNADDLRDADWEIIEVLREGEIMLRTSVIEQGIQNNTYGSDLSDYLMKE